MSSPVSRTRAADAARAGLAGRLGKWRDLRLPIKLALVTFVPMLVMCALGVVVIDGQLAHAAQYARANRSTQLSSSVRASISALQDEREQVAGLRPGQAMPADMAGMPAGAGSPGALAMARHEVDIATAATRQAVAAGSSAGDLDPVAAAAWAAASAQLGTLGALRHATASPQGIRSDEVGSYTQLIDALFAFDRVLTTDVADAQLTRQALSIYDLFAAREEVRYQQAIVVTGIGTHTMSVADVTSLHGSEARQASRINDFRAVANQTVARDYDRSVDPAATGKQSTLLGQAIDESGGMAGMVTPSMAIDVPVTTWNSANRAVTAGLDKVTDSLAGSLQSSAARARSAASTAAAVAVIVLLIALAATIGLAVLITRQLLRSIGLLRRTARDVASRQLPDAVERIRAGETVAATVEPVGVHTTDEVGQLARAFDAVHGEALRLAVEQANLRANYSELFVNLSRRSQSLVQRQLRLIEQLERDEEDPEQLSALFKLDHLATRMRRNNENLMVLSGGELARGNGQQVSLADLLRAAVSEIEHYQRVVVQPPPDTHIVGYAAGDLIRLLAELLDNATAFSSPDTPVTVASHRTRRKAIVIDIVDHGIGMGDEELVRANEQLSHPAGVEGRISRRMGLFVISRLAHQHDVRVRLHGGQDIPGLRVTITVPAELVIGEPDSLPPGGADAGPLGGNGSGALPKRTAGATSGPNGPWHAAMRGTLDAPATTVTPAGDPADPVPGALTVTIPQLPSALSSGVGLFAPLSDEDELPMVAPTVGGGEAVERSEVTPIFDTLSAWFEEPAAAEAEQADAGDSWRFAADEGWQAVDAVVDVEPEEFTSAGLPKRQPKALLLPGSVQPDESEQPPQGVPAEHLRHRLAGFQDGLRRGRREALPDTVRTEPVGQRPPGTPHDGWASLADDAQRAADDVAAATTEITPAETTLAGLPRRRRGEHLLPGSVAPPAERHAAPTRDAGVMRARLSSFQRGVREGRGGTEPTVAEPAEHGFHW